MRELLMIAAMALVGCGSAPSPSKAPASKASETPAPTNEKAEVPTPETAEESPHVDVPTSCDQGVDKPCVMPRAFVKQLCAGAFPELALFFFAKGTPWTRVYVAVRQAEPFNGLGGPSSDKNLEFDEELLVLSENTPNLGGMSVSGVGNSYDVLRWDGTCATLQAGEVRLQRPPQPKHADVDWKRLDEEVRDALSADGTIADLAHRRRQECKGVTMGVVSDKCEKADTALRARVVKLIREGFALPRPSRVP
ncbi:MAG TPA: hypothetical protein PLJ27_08960 [Polyangiaceae bacterium]|jgi:hypothetical protein|nr:MAG: hypothetical protein BWY17_04772 [Deltaproteobacteria bacterium ADurb.Bin207]HNS99057.1 hypothetical protein [Polyangiaceae bacterium]HNZ25454.1 hypothetical protein [Polyangiaceae bacterium]HOD25237.1 hypothetical protein [Polyangiaceae bacterium]HOE51389.1 hypothetical protein [Polyangiaceae bacterium]